MKMLKPDSKGRIALGHLADGVSGFAVFETTDHKIILEPYTEIPSREKWLFENKLPQERIDRGLRDAAAGRLLDKGSFSKYVDEDDIE